MVLGGMSKTLQPMVDCSNLYNQKPELDSVASDFLGDTNRLSELENYNVLQSGRLQSVDLICETALVSFDARFCCVALVDHEKLHILGFAGSLDEPEQELLEVAVSVICRSADCEHLRNEENAGLADAGATRMLALPLQSKNGSKLGAFIVGVDGNRGIGEKERELAGCFVAHSMETLELQRMQSGFARRAEISRRQTAKLHTQKWALIRNDRLFGKVSRMARICGWELDSLSGEVVWSGTVQAVFGLPADADVQLFV